MNMKKILALALALVMVMAVASVAFATAQDVSPFKTTDTVNVTVTGLMEGDTLYLYKVGTPEVDEYKQMTIAWTPEAVGTLVVGATSEAWNYSPSATLQAGIANLIGTGAGKIDVTASTSFTDTVGSGETSATVAVEPGYYLGLVRQGTASAAANIIYQNMLINAIPEPDSATGEWAKHADVTATVKKTEETITKVQKENGSDEWTAETVDGYKRGDFIPFKVTTVIPSYPLNSLYATFQITDTATGLKFVNDSTHPLTLKVNNSDITSTATSTVNTGAADETFVITVGDSALSVVFDKEYILAHPGQAVELTYWAELIAEVETSNNEATITYNRNPDEDTTQDDEDRVDQKTYGFTLLKYDASDSNKNPLVGASFTLWDASENGNQIKVIYDSAIEIDDGAGSTTTVAGYRPIKEGEAEDEYIVATDGTASVYCLGDHTYYLQEDIAPAGYTRMSGRQAITPSASTSVAGIDVEIPNTAGAVLPTTGGIGTTIFYVSGLIMVLGASIILISRRRADAE